uniref:Interleukin-12 subunit alpha n=1 Tax=Mola mola TaxID=94237 RepID=A0A3Q3X261_MOLML
SLLLSSIFFLSSDVSPVLLLLGFISPLWQVSHALPVTSKGPMGDNCVSRAETLLRNVTEKLMDAEIFNGIDCLKQSVELNMETNTDSVCTPKGSTCAGISKSEFNQESCMTSIGEDLHHYYKFLAAYPDPNGLLKALLSNLRELLMKCLSWSLQTEQAAPVSLSPFDERLKLCKVMRGFQVRGITINRAIAYMHSGEHTK